MAYFISESKTTVIGSDVKQQIVAMCDAAADVTSLGTNYAPMSIAVIAEPFGVKILNASGVWKDKTEVIPSANGEDF